MSIDLRQTALLRFLEKRNSTYHGKVFEVRDEVSGWLAYVPQTFPHYTRHTIGHSEEIVSQMSQLLFIDGDVEQPMLPQLSAVEAYILVIAAFLHDSGMVASEGEKSRILATAEWQEWTTSGGGATRWRATDELRSGTVPADPVARNFLADIQVRYLIAEFVRRRHHLRAGDVIREHQEKLGRFAFSDPSLIETIANVCIAHGLASHELADHDRFPDRRDIRGEKVNVRLMAVLLRLGDLLDMSHDRACPLLLSAACPLPAESLAHWSQYQRITHRMTAPDRIEITARCETQDEHRYLHDWCRWLAQEAREAEFTLKESRRHKWDPPKVTLDEPNPTISIAPAACANYIPRNWTFELDSDAVFQRLIHDAYDVPHVFVRELIQNAADANRCQMYDDLKRLGVPRPRYPSDVDKETRERYPIQVTSAFMTRENGLSGEPERLHTITIEDRGIGMNMDVIQHYFLQVGRSFYVTDEFRRNYGFAATSRLGIGFLSTFAESEEIEVETFKAGSVDGAIRLHITGPRSYLLTEHGARTTAGTCIRASMKTPIDDDDIVRMIRHWCPMLEFPIEITAANGEVTTIVAERPEDFIEEVPDFSTPGATFTVRSFPIDEAGVRGQLYLRAWIGTAGEELWSFQSTYSDLMPHPRARIPKVPFGLRALHGVNLQSDWQASLAGGNSFASRIDLRGPKSVTIARSRSTDTDASVSRIVDRAWSELLTKHIATTPTRYRDCRWLYLQALMETFGSLTLWNDLLGTLPMFENGELTLRSISEVRSSPSFLLVGNWWWRSDSRRKDTTDFARRLSERGVPVMRAEDVQRLASYCLQVLTENRSIHAATYENGFVATEWAAGVDGFFQPRTGQSAQVILGDVLGPVPVLYFRIGSMTCVVISKAHAWGRWLASVREACTTHECGFSADLGARLQWKITFACDTGWEITGLTEFIANWREIPNLPPELMPPDVDLKGLALAPT